MNTELKLILSLACLAIVLVSGLQLHRKGQPYSTLLLTIHKILMLGWGVLTVLFLIDSKEALNNVMVETP